MDIPVRMPRTRMRATKWESQIGLLCQAETTSALSHSHLRRVEPLQFHAGVRGCELPVGLGVMFVAFVLPCRDFVDESPFCLGCGDPDIGSRERRVRDSAMLSQLPCLGVYGLALV